MTQIIDWLTALIEYNTTCDTGEEKDCARYIAEELRGQGIDCQLLEPFPGRVSLAARIEGRRPETVVLHAHSDTGEYESDGWRFPPERATRTRGCIVGRGALDCKSQVAVWMKLMADLQRQQEQMEYSVLLLVTADEEQGGAKGMEWIARETDLLAHAILVLGEGGGFPFPLGDRLFYTFQTGEREDEITEDMLQGAKPLQSLQIGIDKGYYAPNILEYYRGWKNLTGRRLDLLPLYAGMEDNFDRLPESIVFSCWGNVFQRALAAHCPRAELMPVLTPGYSDNRFFRRLGIPTIGFFPLEEKNATSGIHGPNEYISEKSLALAYSVISDVLRQLVLHTE